MACCVETWNDLYSSCARVAPSLHQCTLMLACTWHLKRQLHAPILPPHCVISKMKTVSYSWPHGCIVGVHEVVPEAVFVKLNHVVTLREATALCEWPMRHQTPIYSFCCLDLSPNGKRKPTHRHVAVQVFCINCIIGLPNTRVNYDLVVAHALQIIADKTAL
jgi:hypothetical protein